MVPVDDSRGVENSFLSSPKILDGEITSSDIFCSLLTYEFFSPWMIRINDESIVKQC